MDIEYIVDRKINARNHMIAAGVSAGLIMATLVVVQSLWVALPVLCVAVWYRTYEEAYRHYASLQKGLDYEARKAAEMEQR